MLKNIAITADVLHKEAKMRGQKAQERLDFIYAKKSEYWKKAQEKKLLDLFRFSASKIPAYKNFLKKNGITEASVKNIDDFKKKAKPISKDNYLRAYPWEKLCQPRSFTEQSLVLTSTSGSTGQPFYFPRNGLLDAQSSVYHEMFLHSSGLNLHKSTLVLVCFGMGVWIGGVITYEAFKTISERGYPLTIITPGVNKKEIYEAMKNVAPKYDQVILCGYPPFMKDIIDEGPANGVNWKDHDLRMIFAAESFSEDFRDYIMKETGMKNPYKHTMNIYGSADLGTMAQETPLAILIRRLALKNKTLYQKLFRQASRLPTLAQFVPDFVAFEEINGRIYVSGDNVLPLVRYEIGDNGGILQFSEVEKLFKSEGIDLRAEARKAGIASTIAELPFVYVYERTDLSTKLYGAIIYPEYVKAGLVHPTLEKYITGKFTIFTKHDNKQDEYLEINVELRPNTTESAWLAGEVGRIIGETLRERSAEHANNANMLGDKVTPQVVFWPHEHPEHFKTGIKQKWVKK